MSKHFKMTLTALVCCVVTSLVSAADKATPPDPFGDLAPSSVPSPDKPAPAKFWVNLLVARPVPTNQSPPSFGDVPGQAPSTAIVPVSLECEQVTCDVKLHEKGEPEYRLNVTGPVSVVLPEMRIQASEALYQEGKLLLKNVEMTTAQTKFRSNELEIELVVTGIGFGKKMATGPIPKPGDTFTPVRPYLPDSAPVTEPSTPSQQGRFPFTR